MHLRNLPCAVLSLEVSWVAAEAQLSAQQPAQPWEPIGVIGTVIMVTGTDTTFIIGIMAAAGSVHQMEGHMWCRHDIAVDGGDCHSCIR